MTAEVFPPTDTATTPIDFGDLRRRLITRLRARAAGGVATGRLTEVEPLIFTYADMEVSAFIRHHYDGTMVRFNGTKLLVLTAVVTGVLYESDQVDRILAEGAAYPLTSVRVARMQAHGGKVGQLEIYSSHIADQVTDRQLDLALRSMTQHYHHMPVTLGALDLDDIYKERARIRRRKQARLHRTAVAARTGSSSDRGEQTPGRREASTATSGGAVNEDLLADTLRELDELVGLREVKGQIKRLVALVRFRTAREAQGVKLPPIAPHLVFVGNPGTCKTTVAGLIGRIYKALGLLRKGHVNVVGRGDLVAEFSGQTAPRTTRACRDAMDGILFIDEAYALSEHRDSYGLEAIQALLVEMEQHRGRLAVVVAGYPEPMMDFLDSNPGLKSRFDNTITFNDYSSDELADIFVSMAAANGFELDERARTELRARVAEVSRPEGFGNGREVRRWLDAAIEFRAGHWMDNGANAAENMNTLDEESVRSAFQGRDSDAKFEPHAVGYL